MSFENFTQVLQVFKATIVKKIISLFEDISYALTIYQLRRFSQEPGREHTALTAKRGFVNLCNTR